MVERCGRRAIVRDKGLAHTHKRKEKKKGKKFKEKSIFTNLKKEFEHIELVAKLRNYFLRSAKSNINQARKVTDYRSAPRSEANQRTLGRPKIHKLMI